MEVVQGGEFVTLQPTQSAELAIGDPLDTEAAEVCWRPTSLGACTKVCNVAAHLRVC